MKRHTASLPKTSLIALLAVALAAAPMATGQIDVDADAGIRLEGVAAKADALVAVCPLVSIQAHDGGVVLDVDLVVETAALLRATAGGAPVLVADLSGGAQAFVDASVATGVPLTYTVVAGGTSCSKTITVPAEPETQPEPGAEPEQAPLNEQSPILANERPASSTVAVEAAAEAAGVKTTAEATVDLCLLFSVAVDQGNVVIDVDATAKAGVLLRSTIGGTPLILAQLDGQAATFVDADVATGVPLDYRLVVGDDSCSRQVTVAPPQPDPETQPEAGPETGSDPACPTLRITAHNSGSVSIAIDGLTTEAVLLRSEGTATAEAIAELDAGTETYTDVDVEDGAAYAYILAIHGNECVRAEATAQPVFPTLVAAGLGIAASLLGYVGMRRFR